MKIFKTLVLAVFFLITIQLFGQSSIRILPFPTDEKGYVDAKIEAVLMGISLFEKELNFGKKSVLKVRRLKAGNYRIVYKNKFGHYTRKEFALEKGDRNVDIYLELNQLDSVMYAGSRRIDSLNMGDTLTINFHSMGCFHNKKEEISFFRTEESVYATNWVDTVLLDENDLQKVRKFETELVFTHVGGCTTTDFYAVNFKGVEVWFLADGSCDWHGYHKYLYGLFPRSEE